MESSPIVTLASGHGSWSAVNFNGSEINHADHRSPRVSSNNGLETFRCTTCFPIFEPMTVNMRDVLSQGIRPQGKKHHFYCSYLFVSYLFLCLDLIWLLAFGPVESSHG